MSTTIPEPLRSAPGRGCRKDYMPVGTVVIRADRSSSGRRVKTRYIKINDAFPTGKRWIPYARWWWEENKGPVPKGLRVLRKDGNTLNDDPSNLFLGTPGQNLHAAHQRDPEWSKKQRARAAAGAADHDRQRGRVFRARSFVKNSWYPVVDSMSVILNLPFRKRKRVLGVFGMDVSLYPANGHGKKRGSVIQTLLERSPVRPVKAEELSDRRYQTYAVVDPYHGLARGAMSCTTDQLIKQLDRMGIWKPAEKAAKRDQKEKR